MKKKLLIFIALTIIFIFAFTDPYARRIRPFTSVPVACAENEVGYSMTLHNLYICKNTGYVALAVGGSSAPISATYITQTTDGTLTNEQALSALATGVLKNTTATGVLSIAGVSDVDSILPTQAANNGKYLTTNGTISSWGTVTAGITNAAGNNIIPKSNGTNLVASSLSDNSTSIATIEPIIIAPGNLGTGIDVVGSDPTPGYIRLVAGNGGRPGYIQWHDGTNRLGYMGYSSASPPVVQLNLENGANFSIAGGHFIFANDNTNDIGASGATRPRTIYAATSIIDSGSLNIGGGTSILKHLSATSTLDFANLAAIGCEDLTITVTGVALGDTVAIGVPNGSVVANGTFTGWVSAADTVTIRFCTVVSGNPASGTFRADVWQH